MRPIDGDKLVENLRLIATCWSVSPYVSKEKHNGAVNMFKEVVREVNESPTLTTPNEWVSVDERLPPPKQNVLAYSPESGIAEADYGDGVWMQYRWSAVMQGVTHWMPLPAPPDRRPPEGKT